MRILWLLCACALVLGCKGEKGKRVKKITGAEERDLRAKAKRCYERGDYGCAMEALREVVKHRPRDPHALNEFAMAARLLSACGLAANE